MVAYFQHSGFYLSLMGYSLKVSTKALIDECFTQE